MAELTKKDLEAILDTKFEQYQKAIIEASDFKFEKVDGRFEKLENRIDGLEGKIDQRLGKIEYDISELRSEIGSGQNKIFHQRKIRRGDRSTSVILLCTNSQSRQAPIYAKIKIWL